MEQFNTDFTVTLSKLTTPTFLLFRSTCPYCGGPIARQILGQIAGEILSQVFGKIPSEL